MIIEKNEDFLKAQNYIKKIVNIDKGLPDQVFKESFGNFIFADFAWSEGPGFWDTSIKALGKVYGDTEIIVMMIDQDLQDFHLKTFGTYTGMIMPLTFTGKEYYKELHTPPPGEDPINAPYEAANKVVWIPTSGKWAIWGQRSDEACILAFSKTSVVIPKEIVTGMWLPINEALEGFMCLPYRNQQIPHEIAAAFLANYTNPPAIKT